MRWSNDASAVFGFTYPKGTLLEFKQMLMTHYCRHAGYRTASDIVLVGYGCADDGRPAAEVFGDRGLVKTDPIVIRGGPRPLHAATNSGVLPARLSQPSEHTAMHMVPEDKRQTAQTQARAPCTCMAMGAPVPYGHTANTGPVRAG
ncbi:unnamed protein product [Vitrella brassicaformis CCMP3155]|uniref:Uncharacterized protein n=1 Tax=Vitrella brassicaformis (strain CCMP3155) TaxID=1169540 RepID=A0A0G4GIY3_VITBC|nr:unnamed protein product [Vitrella brassicaformis CCMP3155]|eukprot:CEM29786.1 unnamed protein product [Vitrella brassicaformis CCMP3155]